ncbi:RES family NAD+ phosphorylase [Pectobacterium versatile]|uniref:RES family NAD+ phosphorylase n=1 Tax=Pectobacterium versatile TaxID=2488639 RepID=UPI000D1AA528|nr:RES family NAD+ phosphorylase [Pectobacterium versatile]AVT58501.1 RES domain protein [Pectobacterium versatile]UCP83521.1 RES family NAD+ phosphorylase [Pectobacterium versatile]
MRLYRITKAVWLEAFSGQTGVSFQHGARFNQPNTPVLYFSETPAVAMLEMGNYLPSPQLLPASYRLGVYELPDDVPQESITLDMLPEDWHRYPFMPDVQALGSRSLNAGHSLVIWVPTSTVKPFGSMRNALINPLHPALSQLRLIEAIPDFYSHRLFNPIGH